MEEMNREQIQSLIGKLNSLNNEEIKKELFSHLGEKCYSCRGIDTWISSFNNSIEAMIDWVAKNESPYWEKLEFDNTGETLILTGKRVDSCVCEYSNPEHPPKSLCEYCCRQLQQLMWSNLLQREVDVEITEAANLGGNRCSTKIHFKREEK